MAKQSTGLTVKATEGRPFTEATVVSSSDQNSAETSYNFSLTLSNDLSGSVIFEVKPPSQVLVLPYRGSLV